MRESDADALYFLRDGALKGHDVVQQDLESLIAVCQHVTLVAGQRWSPDEEAEASVCLLMTGLVVLSQSAMSAPLAIAPGQGFAVPVDRGPEHCPGVRAAESSQLIVIEEARYQALELEGLPPFDHWLTSIERTDLDSVGKQNDLIPLINGKSRVLRRPIADVMTSQPISVDPETSIRDVAQRMQTHGISCMLVTRSGELTGLLTEADMTRRVVAQGRSVDEPVANIMSTELHTLSPRQTVFDTVQLLTRNTIAHVPVVDDHKLVGIVTQTDIVRQQTGSPLFLVNDIAGRTDSAAIAEDTKHVPQLLRSLVDAGATADEVGLSISSVSDAVTRRFVELALIELGDAPVPWVWMACGSQGRQEQTGKTDQDNCLILSDDFVEAEHGEWFKAFAETVCTGLDKAGYVYCPGDMMAMTPRWRQPVTTWRRYFTHWIRKPGTEAQMLASVMFDLRPIIGDATLSEPLQHEVLTLAADNSLFIAHMVSNSLKHRPPLGLFGRLATQRRGPHRQHIDLKHGGVVPIVDLARLQALSAAVPEVNTLARLKATVEGGMLSTGARRDLCDAYEFIASLRLHQQCSQIKAGIEPDNYLNPATLSSLERTYLRDAMMIVRSLQSTLGQRHSQMS